MVKKLLATQETWVASLGQEIPWRRAWQPTPAFLLGEYHGQRSLVGCSPWGHKESHTTEQLSTAQHSFSGASLVAQKVKNSPAVKETWVPYLGQEDPLEEGMATHSSILAWRIP